MRRTVPFVLMISLLFASGCAAGSGNWEMIDSIRQELQTAKTLSMTARVCTSEREYTLKCDGGGDEYVVAVLEPELIAGVTAVVESGSLTLSYDGAELAAGELDPSGLNPVSVLPCIADTLTNGFQTLVWNEELLGQDCIVSQFRVSEDTVLTAWIEPELRAPVYAELDSNGKVIVSCTFTTWIRG